MVLNVGKFSFAVYSLTSFAQEVAPSAKFDVIIKKDGSIIYGLVKEVGLLEIKYQRTDIPDGPIYTIPRNEVYAISYRNQIKEYLSAQKPAIFNTNTDSTLVQKNRYLNNNFDFNDAEFRLQIGFFKGFSKLANKGDYISKLGFVPITLAYDVGFLQKYRIGLSLGTASYKYNKNSFNNYDSTQVNSDVKERQFVANIYMKKRFGSGLLQPFALFGVGVNSSLITSSSKVTLNNAAARQLFVSSEGRSTSLGVQVRFGFDYDLQNQFKISADVGSGLSVLQVGAIYKFN
ncbi:MAG: hypothetical protein IE931_03260 [Sphingobacteriales bacterium]|nr:hypothetical protein [Sphingobacteriales bacterium]